MSMLDIHAAALATTNVAYHELLLHYKSTALVVYGVVEGRDDPCYYRGMIEQLLPDHWELVLIKAGNKNKVLKLFGAMDWTRFPQKRIAFFVDRDMSAFLRDALNAHDNLYVTDQYSIDCEIVTWHAFERTLYEVMGLTDVSPTEAQTIKILFENNLARFRESMCPIMAQILLWRRMGAEVSLNKIQPKELFVFNAGCLNLKASYASPSDRIDYSASMVNAPPSQLAEICAAESEFRSNQGPEKFTRGKYLVWFFAAMVNEIHQNAPNFCAKHTSPPRACTGLGMSNAMAVVGPRTRCPASLRAFIHANFSLLSRIYG
jgi:uncharacterized protein DUF4435